MRKILWTVLFVIFVIFPFPAGAAEYQIRKGDSIGSIAKQLRQSVECLCYANVIDEKNFKIVAGEKLIYADEDDIRRAENFAMSHIMGMTPEHPDYAYFLRLHGLLKTRNMKCSKGGVGIDIIEIIALSQAEKAY